MASIKSDQNSLIVFYRLTLDNGATYLIYASPLSPETGREILGNYTEDYTLIGLLLPAAKAQPFLKGVRISESYIKSTLGIEEPLSSLLFDLMPQLTQIDIPDLIIRTAERWYSNYYGQGA